MPRTATWYARIPDAIARLRDSGGGPWVPRDILETLLGIRRRRAQQLMQTMPTIRLGNVACVERKDLIVWLENTLQEPGAEKAIGRRERLEETLRQALYGRKRISTGKQTLVIRAAGLAELAGTTVLRPGELQVRFTSMQDLMQQLFSLSQALANDYPAIEPLLRP